MNGRFMQAAGAVATVICLQSTASAAGANAMATPDEPYAMRTVVTGSMIAQDVVRGPIPFDKRYDQLTPEQKQVLFADDESMPAGDEPPFPQYGLGHMLRQVRQFVSSFDMRGEVVLKVDIDAAGDPVTVKVFKAPNPDVAQLIGSEVAIEKFKPAGCAGQPCAGTFVLRVDLMDHDKDPLKAATDSRVFSQGSHYQM